MRTVIGGKFTEVQQEKFERYYQAQTQILSNISNLRSRAPGRGRVRGEESADWLGAAKKVRLQGIYCSILRAYVKKCELASCKNYAACHKQAYAT